MGPPLSTPKGLKRVFEEEHPGSRFTAGRKDVKIVTEGALKQHAALEVHIRQKMTSKDCHIHGEKSLASADGFP